MYMWLIIMHYIYLYIYIYIYRYIFVVSSQFIYMSYICVYSVYTHLQTDICGYQFVCVCAILARASLAKATFGTWTDREDDGVEQLAERVAVSRSHSMVRHDHMTCHACITMHKMDTHTHRLWVGSYIHSSPLHLAEAFTWHKHTHILRVVHVPGCGPYVCN